MPGPGRNRGLLIRVIRRKNPRGEDVQQKEIENLGPRSDEQDDSWNEGKVHDQQGFRLVGLTVFLCVAASDGPGANAPRRNAKPEGRGGRPPAGS
ncbi:unnamed protein product [Boreogadus saida]